MIIQNIIGGLGNQLFQYAFIYAQSRNRNTSFKLDISNFETYHLRKYALDQYKIKNIIASDDEVTLLKYKNETKLDKLIRKILKKPKSMASSYYKEPGVQFDCNVFFIKGDIYFDGYWQSARYFENYRNELLKQFTLKLLTLDATKKYLEKISSTESVSLHIRRGDYVTNPRTNAIHGTCSISYYQNAVSHIKKNIKQPYIFIFSDDLMWAKDNLSINEQLTFIELNNKFSDCDEIFLMSHCKHNIIANSSFSWWGAWLNTNPNKIVIAPQHWFNDSSLKTDDLIPASWVQL
ncbi:MULTISPECIES: alpha-1,2-fucosyltransferase [Methylomonas]|uniref:Glycosyl transferase family 11 n=2 Tax=Methylomonas TaxID=416 RepID=A0A140E5M4_9GAMM|nr:MULTISPECIES: alpha-1,2-fucosyltransferase [Methylomonas]AMK78698.1 hypothetical protein JT25_019760 [Methylomonas denitrificans]OAI03694.1 hypothetical protein A1342_01015 [Methylomonas methanica]TCV83549.1 glycosyl transferase family 11 [Methylomonas methanica]